MRDPIKEPADHSIISHIVEKAEGWGLEIQNHGTNTISVWTSRYIGLRIRLWIDNDETIRFNYYCRTNSWFYGGERTDLHDSFTVFFAVFLKKLNLCSIFTIMVHNPATGADAEIYGNYLIPEQIHPGLINAKTVDLEKLDELVGSLSMFEQYVWELYGGCPCENCRKELKYDFEYRRKDIEKARLNRAKKVAGDDPMLTNYMERTLPTWFYYRNFKTKVTLIDSPEIMPFFHALSRSSSQIIKGISGDLIVVDQFQHYLSNSVRKKLYEYFKQLEEKLPDLVILENKIVAVGERVILTVDTKCGVSRFKKEREKVRERHQTEFDVLFKPHALKWADKIQDDVFEDLIKELLEREPNVNRVRKLAHTRERDKGADLVAEWVVSKDSLSPDEDPYMTINVIVQCKAYKNGVGKSDVQDIRDTVEHREYDTTNNNIRNT
ncbi:restriction endonuclease [Mucilaginibacter auburnensis]|uniref:Restriction endonuclease n=1 Tax=Mucilaginibacter auburnensis TaxID=1457233 RepID=A0A2H9VR72_9SPHI|nr:restriction endonuclease [Mucilaginibacter auburnensis]PJJ83305.1 restriction endonuclease [Mucilaginibacter auburnensis]